MGHATAFNHSVSAGVVPPEGTPYTYNMPIGDEQMAWNARIGTPGARYQTDKRLVTSRASFLLASSMTSGTQVWRSAPASNNSPNPTTCLLASMVGPVRIRHNRADTELSPGQFTVCTTAEPIIAEYLDTYRVILAFLGHTEFVDDNRFMPLLGKAISVEGIGLLLLQHVDACTVPKLDAGL